MLPPQALSHALCKIDLPNLKPTSAWSQYHWARHELLCPDKKRPQLALAPAAFHALHEHAECFACQVCALPRATSTACAQPVQTEGCPGSRAAAPGLQALHALLARGTSLPVCCLLPCCDRHVRTQWPAQSIVLAAAQPRWCLRLKSTGMMRQAGVLRLFPEHYPIPQVPLAQAHPNPAVFVQCGIGRLHLVLLPCICVADF